MQASPRIRFNKEGSLLAVTTSDNGIKILANSDGQRLIRMLEGRTFEGSRIPEQINAKVSFILHLYGIDTNYLFASCSNACFCPLLMQPPIVGQLASVASVSTSLGGLLGRQDQVIPAVSMPGLVC